MMKKYIILLALMFSCSLSAQSLRNYFVSMPDSVIPLLTKINREDCIDFLDSKMKAEVKNRFGKPSELKMITDNYLLLQTTPSSTVEMKLLSVNDSTKIIGVIKTYMAKAADSDLAFYSTSWQMLDANKFINVPDSRLVLAPDSLSGNIPMQEVSDIMNLPLRKASFSADNTSLMIEYTSPQLLNEQQQKDMQIVSGDIKMRFEWQDGKYIEKK